MRVPTWKGKKYPVVRFRSIDGIHVATSPWPRAFLATREVLEEGYMSRTIELRELTIRTLAVLLLQNWVSQGLWRLHRGAWRLGFLDADEARPFSEATWRWRFWAPRQGTAPADAGHPHHGQGVRPTPAGEEAPRPTPVPAPGHGDR
jgi:hypothetical protein